MPAGALGLINSWATTRFPAAQLEAGGPHTAWVELVKGHENGCVPGGFADAGTAAKVV